MIKTYKVSYEIWDTDTSEVLASNLSFEEAIEKQAEYQQFFEEGISVAIRETHKVHSERTNEQDYKVAWINYFAVLQTMGNLN